MNIQAQTYDDFKVLTGNMTTPKVYDFISGTIWSAWAISGDVGVSLTLTDGEPATFDTDFPGSVDLLAPISIS